MTTGRINQVTILILQSYDFPGRIHNQGANRSKERQNCYHDRGLNNTSKTQPKLHVEAEAIHMIMGYPFASRKFLKKLSATRRGKTVDIYLTAT